MKNLLSDAVNFSPHTTKFFFGIVSVKSHHAPHRLFFSPSLLFVLVCVELGKLQEKHLSDLEKAVLLRMSD